MTGIAIALVLMSCVLHAGWNLLVKRASDKDAFTALSLAASSVLYLPTGIFFAIRQGIPAGGWIPVAISGVLYAVYYLALSSAYRLGDLSYAYPLARGVGPALTAVLGVALLGERVTAAGLAGVAIIVGAVAILQAPLIRTGSSISRKATGWAVLVGMTYAVYSVVDKTAVSRVGVHPALYIYLTYMVAASLVVPTVLYRAGLSALTAEWQRSRFEAIVVGLLGVAAYLLVLVAMAMPRAPVAYVVPLRTVSVLLGVLGGVRLLDEKGAWNRTIAALLTMAGVALVAWKG